MTGLSTMLGRRAILRGIRAAVWVALASVSTVSAPAQDAQDAQGSFSDTLDIQAVDLEVLVSDRKGEPVPGLGAADFRLLVDGKEVPVEYFAEISDGAAVPPPASPASPDGGAAIPAPLALRDTDLVGNNYLVFVDEFFTPPAMRNEALRGLAREAATLRPQDRMAVVSYDGRKLSVLSPWVPPGEPLQEFLTKLAEQKASLAATPFSVAELEPTAHRFLVFIRNQLEPVGPAVFGGTIVDGALNEKREGVYIDRSIGAASAALRSFAAVSGRKLLVLLSGGWNYENKIGKKSNKRYERLQPLIDTCNTLGYTIYPIHLAQNGPADLPRNASVVVAGAATGVGYSSSMTGGVHQGGLLTVAGETGGKFLLPGNNRHLSRIAADTRSYYWLGFTHAGGSGRHAVRVEVSRPGLEVRTRKSFAPLSRQARLDLDLERALLAGDTRGMGTLDISLGAFAKADGAFGELPVTVRVPAEKLALTEQGGRYVGKLELRIAAMDDEGNRSEVPVLAIDIARDEAPKPGAVIRYDARLRLRHTPQEVQLLLYDTVGGKSFAERVRVQP